MVESFADAMQIFQRTYIEEGRPYAAMSRWSRAEANGILTDMGKLFVETLEALAELIEAEDWDEIVALAAQEQTRRMIRGVR